MNEVGILPAPVLDLPPQGKWEREQQAFQQLLPQLLQTHAGQFVAIHEGKVVGAGGDLVSVALQAYQQFGYVPIYVDLVTAERRTVRIPSPRIVGSPSA